MARLQLFILLFFLGLFLFSQPRNREFILNNGQIILLGQTDKERLMLPPFDEWFDHNYQVYQSGQVPVNEAIYKVDSIEIFMATWCGDSRREVPRFLKIMEELDFGPDKLRIICVDRGWGNYKKSPGGEENGKNIHRVPTFIFYRNGKEMGRIVETPVSSLEEDINEILTGEYIPYYGVVHDLDRKLQNEPLEEIEKHLKSLASEYKNEVRNVWELSTYAKKLLTSFEIEKARLVYDLNALIYPDELWANFYRGVFYEIWGNERVAIACFSKCLEIEPGHSATLEKLSKFQ